MDNTIEKIAQGAYALLELQSDSIAQAKDEFNTNNYEVTFTKAVVAELPELSKPKVDKAVAEMEADGYVFQKQKGRTAPYRMSIKNVVDIYEHRGIPKYRARYNEPHVIFVVNLKGGVAKTVSVVTLAHGLKCTPTLIKQDLRILVIDLDPQASATMFLNQEIATDGTEFTAAQAMLQNLSTEELVADFIKPSNLSGVDILPASIEDGFIASDLIDLAQEHLPDQKVYNLVQENIINKLKGLYDFCLIDSGPHLDGFLLNSMAAADTLLVPVPPDSVDFNSSLKFLKRMPSLFNKINNSGSSTNDPSLYTFMVKTKKLPEHDRVSSELKGICGANFLSHGLPFTTPFAKCGDSFDTIFTVQPETFTANHRTLKSAREKAQEFALDVFDTINFNRQ